MTNHAGVPNEDAESTVSDSPSIAMSRRNFLGSMAAFTLALSFHGGTARAAAVIGKSTARLSFEPNAFIRVAADGKVTVISSYLEMGQGTFTGLATLAAEELDVSLSDITVTGAPADVEHYINPVLAARGFKVQATGGSTAMAGAWVQMRHAAATARTMFVAAAAKRFGVPRNELVVENGVVVHPRSGRRATYGSLVAAASAEPIPKEVVLKDHARFRFIGKNGTRRLDVPAKVNGSAIYTQDIRLPGMLVAAIAHPPKLWAKIRSIDSAKALAVPGVVAVVRVPGDDEIQGGAAVLARNTWAARQGRDALKIEWDERGALTADSFMIVAKFRELAGTPGVVAKARGKVLDGTPSGAKVIDAIYEQPYLAHAPMEPLNCVVHLTKDRCEIWNGEQWHTGDSNAAAKELGFALNQVQLHQLYAGGSFGRRANPRSDFVREAVRIAIAARKAGIDAPIKMVWMREDDMRGVQYRPLTVHRVRAIVDASGQLASWHHRIVGQSFMPSPDPTTVDDNLVEGAADTGYAIPNFRVEQHSYNAFAIPVAWLRSVGHTHTAFVVETMIDELAAAAGKDPYAFRRQLLQSSPRDLGVLDLAVEKAGWGKPLPASKPGDRRARGIAVHASFGTHVAQVAEVTLHQDGSYSVDRIVCAVDCGTVINPDIVASQIEGAAALGLSFLHQAITFKQGQVQESNFHDYPILRMNAMPRVEVYMVSSTAAPTGIGEPGTPLPAPAVANALAAITGRRIRALPLRDDVLAA
ncbi:xanthine dehydrogenase family protein molybdopterin-binding subunit [Burkholderia orbicola]|uniref:Xanthine dehydrogenase family protein molybdopterin-binding subunit n=1 Tax=Burkholderia orbicola TaxID=2978683 RepID=A0ABT8NVN6_9BURK|nr:MULTISPECIES: xanthine dehydrogenase family protein molybdopterin-binding subunit [Burkholderia cepacia complex]MBR8070875.1 xanthine dehydrogenase family protein molybdopterin-binding subunit [Burkholderia cenocepacia]MBR8448297.1 xanthine dehydrogenase family protein molybdopterin-binding subunit [Burkholderia cenocepacia]MDN7525640.1 xanthine dehydrogenase family protein molybdopterin-binding subunit [Burkholderia orbicola]MDN7989335.1 xanthine dehydrogenase family protein molybdopterin-b